MSNRFTVDIDGKLLDALAKDRKCDKAEIVQRALVTYSVLAEEVKAGRKIQITDADDHIVKEILFY